MTRLLDVDEPDRARVLGSLRTAAAASGAQNWVVEPDPARIGATAEMFSSTRSDSAPNYFNLDLDDPAITRVNGADYTGMPIRTGEPGSVYRALLLSVTPTPTWRPSSGSSGNRQMLPRYVSSIALGSSAQSLSPSVRTAWTHVRAGVQ